MNKLFLITTFLLTFVLMTGFNKTETSKKHKNIVGTWKYEALEAPYEYQTGEFVFERNEDNLIGFAMIAMSKIEMEDIIVNNNNISFKCNIQGENVSIDFTISKKSFTGSAISSGGTIPLTGLKIK